MNVLRKVLLYLLIIISTILILASLFSLLYDIPFWFLKILDFPRFQYMILGLLLLILFPLINKKWNFYSYALILGLIGSVIIQAYFITPYLVGNKAVPDAGTQAENPENKVSILIANVLMTNKKTEPFIDVVLANDPDMVLAMEVNEWWVTQLKELEKKYPYVIEYPTDNAYGIILYSKVKLSESKIMFLNHKDVPAIKTKVEFPSGDKFIFYGVHPVSPAPSSKYPDNVNEKEVALIKVGRMVANDSLPVIVAGDYNDVSWSNTSRLFEDQGNLHNVRIGRGLYNSYNAKSLIKRWPLDHFFVSSQFSLIKLQRLSKINSDHFPILASFILN